jgi:DNA-binding transcriptional LysR family regulator
VTGSALFHPRVIETFRRFHTRYPDVDVEIVQDDTGVLASSLRDGSLDVAFLRTAPAANEGDDERALRFPDEHTVAILPSSHPHARAKRVKIARLTGETLLIFPRRAGPSFYDATVAACHRAGFEPRRLLEVPQITAMPSFVAAGLGVAFVPQSFAAIALPGVAYVPIAGEAPVAPLLLLLGSDSPITARFAALARDVRDSRVAARTA